MCGGEQRHCLTFLNVSVQSFLIDENLIHPYNGTKAYKHDTPQQLD